MRPHVVGILTTSSISLFLFLLYWHQRKVGKILQNNLKYLIKRVDDSDCDENKSSKEDKINEVSNTSADEENKIEVETEDIKDSSERRENESLIEWIDRQLLEAEERKRLKNINS